jgi:hypothetical protein
MSFSDKRAALLGAFCARFALGFFAATVRLPTKAVAAGVLSACSPACQTPL